jgi:hypothetical protein
MASAVWTKLLEDASIQRSSQTLTVIANNAYVYGGELRPREPVDSAVYRVSVGGGQYPMSGCEVEDNTNLNQTERLPIRYPRLPARPSLHNQELGLHLPQLMGRFMCFPAVVGLPWLR